MTLMVIRSLGMTRDDAVKIEPRERSMSDESQEQQNRGYLVLDEPWHEMGRQLVAVVSFTSKHLQDLDESNDGMTDERETRVEKLYRGNKYVERILGRPRRRWPIEGVLIDIYGELLQVLPANNLSRTETGGVHFLSVYTGRSSVSSSSSPRIPLLAAATGNIVAAGDPRRSPMFSSHRRVLVTPSGYGAFASSRQSVWSSCQNVSKLEFRSPRPRLPAKKGSSRTRTNEGSVKSHQKTGSARNGCIRRFFPTREGKWTFFKMLNHKLPIEPPCVLEIPVLRSTPKMWKSQPTYMHTQEICVMTIFPTLHCCF